jgi:hypothetical protein
MASEKALYWLAVGVMGITFMQSSFTGFQDRLNDFEGRSVQVAEQFSSRASNYLGMMHLGVRTARQPDIEVAMARMQARMACAQTGLVRRQAGLARLDAARVRIETPLAGVESRVENEPMAPSF